MPLFSTSSNTDSNAEDMLTVETAGSHRLRLSNSPLFNDGLPFNIKFFHSEHAGRLETIAAQHLSADGEELLALGDESVRVFQTPGYGRTQPEIWREKACDFLTIDPSTQHLRLRELKFTEPTTVNIAKAVLQLQTSFAAIRKHWPQYTIDRAEIIFNTRYRNKPYLRQRTEPLAGETERSMLLNESNTEYLYVDNQRNLPISIRLMEIH